MAKKKRTDDGDRLGSLKMEYRTNAAGIFALAGLLFLGAVGTLGASFFLAPPTSWYLLMGGTLLLVLAPVILLANVFNVGRSFQVRKHGVRYVEAGVETELTWDEIVAVDVQETRYQKYGVVTVKTEYELTIQGRKGRTIQLGALFLQQVPDVKMLAKLLRHKAEIG